MSIVSASLRLAPLALGAGAALRQDGSRFAGSLRRARQVTLAEAVAKASPAADTRDSCLRDLLVDE